VSFAGRVSGVQLHITSLPGGTLGPEAYAFVDWLAAAGQSWWQVLPLAPPGRGRSPYAARSAFAGSPALLGSPRARVTRAECDELRQRESYWIEDWIRFAGRDALADQVRFQREWLALRRYANERGVRLLGDVAIYVAAGSADHRSHPELFQSDAVAGVPPDVFTDKGQLWGSPLYDWGAMRRDGYRWWVERTRRTLALFDATRLDHFRGFVAYWAVPAGASDARGGQWRRGPGRALFARLATELGEQLPLIAEDLGVITAPVARLRDELQLPGMLVLEFGFGPGRRSNPHRFVNHVEPRVVYIGTHDHPTARAYYEGLPATVRAELDAVCHDAGVHAAEPWWRLIELALASPARIAILQAQDLLGLGATARMNNPATQRGNWRWRLAPGALTPALAARLREVTLAAGR
jgi:4-alpha-glucanotransferase